MILAFALAPAAAESQGSVPVASPRARSQGGECPPTPATLALVQGRYDTIQDLSANFEQETQSAVFGGALAAQEVSRGEVLFAKPGRMRWNYREPEPSAVISDGKTLWVYDVAGAQVTRIRLDEGYLAGAALQFLFGSGRLAETFSASTLSCTATAVEVELKPRKAESYELLSVTADRESGLVTGTAIVDLFGNRTSIRFSETQLNQSPAADEFKFVRPKGVELLDLSEGS
jgi:outer membrane lipoprotein carrier protein